MNFYSEEIKSVEFDAILLPVYKSLIDPNIQIAIKSKKEEENEISDENPVSEELPEGDSSIETPTCDQEEDHKSSDEIFHKIAEIQSSISHLQTMVSELESLVLKSSNAPIKRRDWEVIFYVDFLYLKAIEDSLRYAEKVPQNPTNTPVIQYIGQNFEWDPGFRVGVALVIPYDRWEVGGDWMYFHSHPDSVTDYDADYGILSGLSTPVFGSAGNSLVQKVKGNWQLQMNVFNIGLKRKFSSHGKISIIPRFGVMGSVISQRVSVTYENFLIQYPNDNTPQRVIGNSRYWGVGPSLNIGGRFELPKQFGFYLEGGIATLFGNFNLKTTYKNLLNAPSSGTISMYEYLQRLQLWGGCQAGIFKKIGDMEIALGWQGQIWWDQMRMNWFSTVVSPQDGANLTLNGFFANSRWEF